MSPVLYWMATAFSQGRVIVLAHRFEKGDEITGNFDALLTQMLTHRTPTVTCKLTSCQLSSDPASLSGRRDEQGVQVY